MSGEPDLSRDGFSIQRRLLSPAEVDPLLNSIASISKAEPVKPYGIRSIAERCPEVLRLAGHPGIREIVESASGRSAKLVRSIFFDKVPGANWHVGWHQDMTIAVRERPVHPVSGFDGWTEKEGTPHVQAPDELLAKMVTLRVSLDDCGPENGPLRVLPGSHVSKLGSAEIGERTNAAPAIECCLEAGDAVAMRPMLLHASHRAESPGHRRVVHLEFAPADALPESLSWAAA